MSWTRQSAINWIHDEIKAGRLHGTSISEAYRRAYKLPLGNDVGKTEKHESFKDFSGKGHTVKKCRYCGCEFEGYAGQDNICSGCYIANPDELLKVLDGNVPVDN